MKGIEFSEVPTLLSNDVRDAVRTSVSPWSFGIWSFVTSAPVVARVRDAQWTFNVL